jgi:predicted nucleic acid-binding protein
MLPICSIDTDILIDAGRDVQHALDTLDTYEAQGTLVISVVTQLELIVGCENKRELNKLEKFLRRFEVKPLGAHSSQIAVDLLRQYRLSHGLLIPDALVAATAIALGLPLLTKNQRDFRFIRSLTLLPYP